MLPRAKSFGEQALGGLGQGIGSGLQALANMKLKQMQQQSQADQLAPFWQNQGVSQDIARALSMQPPQIQAQYLKNLESQRADAEWNKFLTGGGNRKPTGEMPYQQPSTEGMTPQQTPQAGEMPYQQPSTEGMTPQFRGIQNMSAGELATLGLFVPEKRRKSIEAMGKYKQKQEEFKEKRIEKEKERDIKSYGQHSKLINTTISEHKKLSELKEATKELKDITLRDNLPHAIVKQAIDKMFSLVGIKNTQRLWSGDTQLYQSIAKEFLKQGRTLFGSKPTQKEMEWLMEAIPSLMNSPEGRLQILEHMRYAYDLADTNYDAMMELHDKYQDRLPNDFEFKLSKRSDQLVNKIRKAWETSQFEGEEQQPFKVGTHYKTNDYSTLPNGTIVTRDDGKDVMVVNGKLRLVKE